MKHRTMLLAVAIAIAVLAACGNAPSKSGGNIGTTTIHTPVGDPNTPGGDLMDHIRTQLRTVSNGAFEVATGGMPDPSDVDAEIALLELVREGEADISIVRSAVFSSVGVTGFAALQAPFLIENQEAAELVAADPIAQEMLDLLEDLDLVGLAVVPSGLRHPFGWYSPLVDVGDYANARINTRPGNEVDMIFEALGATTEHSVGQERTDLATNGVLNGVEVSLQMKFSVGPPLIMTSNVVIYNKFDVVVANKRFFDGLTDTQQSVVRAAVAAAIPETLAGRDTEAEAFATWCGEVGNVAVVAQPSDIEAMRQATAPMIAELERDPFTKKAIERIRELSAESEPADLGTCQGPAPESIDIEPAGDQSVIDGTWRFEVTEQNLIDAGVPAAEAAKDVGVHTFVFQNGTLTGDTPTIDCFGTYRINSSQFSWAFDPSSCGGNFRGTFARDGDTMTFTIDQSTIDGPFFAGFFKNGLTRIAGVPR